MILLESLYSMHMRQLTAKHVRDVTFIFHIYHVVTLLQHERNGSRDSNMAGIGNVTQTLWKWFT